MSRNILAALSLLAGIPAFADEIRVCADLWMPVNGADDAEDNQRGYLIEIAEKAWGSAGHVLVYENMPWKRAIEVARTGRCDCLPGAYKADAPDFIFPAQPLGQDQPTFYTLTGSPWRYTSLGSLADVQLGLVSGYMYGDAAFDRHVAEGIRAGTITGLSGTNASALLLDLLVAGRVGAILDSNLVVGYALAERNMTGKVQPAGRLGDPVHFYMACAPGNPRAATYVRQLDEGVARLRKSGELKTILDRYGLMDWQ